MTTNSDHVGETYDNSDGRITHAAFQDVAAGMLALVMSLEAKYQEGDELDPILVHNLIEGMAAFLALYAVARFCPAARDTRGLNLNRRLVDCVTATIGLTPMAPEIVKGTYPTGWPETA
jgi:hypothetical protein